MATNTTNFNLSKPDYTDTADIAVINSNMDKVDVSLNGLADAIAIVAKNNTHAAITAGQYVYVHGHGSLAEGLYTAKSNISANATLSTSNLQADESGGLNTLIDKRTYSFGNVTESAFETAIETQMANYRDGEGFFFVVILSDSGHGINAGTFTGIANRSASTRINVIMQQSGTTKTITYLGCKTTNGWSFNQIAISSDLANVYKGDISQGSSFTTDNLDTSSLYLVVTARNTSCSMAVVYTSSSAAFVLPIATGDQTITANVLKLTITPTTGNCFYSIMKLR